MAGPACGNAALGRQLEELRGKSQSCGRQDKAGQRRTTTEGLQLGWYNHGEFRPIENGGGLNPFDAKAASIHNYDVETGARADVVMEMLRLSADFLKTFAL